MIRTATFTNIGDHTVNEDSLGVSSKGEEHCFILCDGLGGHGMGDTASRLAVNTALWKFNDVGAKDSLLTKIFDEAQAKILSEQLKIGATRQMKTTAVIMALDKKKAYVGHIGDTRLYAFRKNKVDFRTLDHSVPQMLVAAKEIKESEIRNHPERNLLLRVLGTSWDGPEYELRKKFRWKKYQAFLLCSDGFWELITEEKMCEYLEKSSSVEEWLEKMSKEVAYNGVGKRMDNYSAIAIWNEK